MPLIRRILPCVLVLTLAAAGCSVHKQATRQESPTVIPSTGETAPQYYTANFTCSSEGVTANGQLRMQTDSVIWLSASKIIELARARFTHDSVIIHAKVMGRCFRGNYNDLYRRFQFRTDFNQLQKTLTSPDAETQLATIARQMGIDATFTLQPWQKAERLTFPIPIPDNVNPL